MNCASAHENACPREWRCCWLLLFLTQWSSCVERSAGRLASCSHWLAAGGVLIRSTIRVRSVCMRICRMKLMVRELNGQKKRTAMPHSAGKRKFIKMMRLFGFQTQRCSLFYDLEELDSFHLFRENFSSNDETLVGSNNSVELSVSFLVISNALLKYNFGYCQVLITDHIRGTSRVGRTV